MNNVSVKANYVIELTSPEFRALLSALKRSDRQEHKQLYDALVSKRTRAVESLFQLLTDAKIVNREGEAS